MKHPLAVMAMCLLLVGIVALPVTAITYGTPTNVSVYPYNQSFSGVNVTSYHSEPFYPFYMTNNSLTVNGSWNNNGWVNGTSPYNKFLINLDAPTIITKIYYENGYTISGFHYVTSGIKNFTFWGSNSATAFLNTAYNDNTGWTQIPTNELSFKEHTNSSISVPDPTDPQFIAVTNPSAAYQYYAINFDSNYGGPFQAIRRIELQVNNSPLVSSYSAVTIGDSISRGWIANKTNDGGARLDPLSLNITPNLGTYAGEMMYNYTGWNWYNNGINGDTTTKTLARWPRDAMGYTYSVGDNYGAKTLNTKPHTVIINSGINDIKNLVNIETTKNNLYNMAVNASQNNVSTIFITVFPHPDPYFTNISSLNSWMLTNLTNISTTTRVYNASVILDDGSHSIKTEYDIDGTHINQNAYVVLSKDIYNLNIDVLGRLTTDFSSFNTQGTAPFTTYLYDTSTNLTGSETFGWVLGDGNTSTLRNVTHTWVNPGLYTINHSASNGVTTSWKNVTNYINVTNFPEANFTPSTYYGVSPLNVVFTDTSKGIGITNWLWDFGDFNTSILQNPSHTFVSDGIYTVNLTVTSPYGVSSILKNITVSDFSSSFTGSPAAGTYPLTVAFTETTTGLKPDSFYYEFGDGNTSTLQNPTHTYVNHGYYTVNNRIVNGSTVYWNNKTNYIEAWGETASFTVSNTTAIGFPLVVLFTSTTTNTNATPSSYLWVFGDGTQSTSGSSVTHTYDTTFGTFNANLTTANVMQGVSSTSASTTLSRIPSNTVSNISYNWVMNQIFPTTIMVKDSETLALINGVTLTGDGVEYVLNNGIHSNYYEYGPHTFTIKAVGYTTKTTSLFVVGNSTFTIELVPTFGSDVQVQVYPQYVTFYVKEFLTSTPIVGADIHIIGVSTSTGSWDWVAQLLGIPLDTIEIHDTELSQTTDSYGTSTFYMIPTVKYNVTFTKEGYTIPSMMLVPQDTNYVIYGTNTTSGFYESGYNELTAVNITMSTTPYNDTAAFINISYNDTLGTTTGGTITIYKDSTSRIEATTAIAVIPVTEDTFTNSTLVPIAISGTSYRIVVNTTTDSGNVVRTFATTFKGSGVDIPGFTEETQLWLALFIIIFTAAFAGAVHSPQISIVVCTESWVFWGIGWLDALISQFNYGEESLIGILILASFFAVWWNITEGKAKGKRSS